MLMVQLWWLAVYQAVTVVMHWIPLWPHILVCVLSFCMIQHAGYLHHNCYTAKTAVKLLPAVTTKQPS